MVKNKKCLSCQTAFSYCPDCSGADRLAPAWRAEFCSSDCKTLWSTATKFNMNKLTKAEAKSIISALNLKPAGQYVACIQRDLNNIMAEEPKIKRNKKAAMPAIKKAIAPEIKEELKLPEPVVESTALDEVAPVEEIHTESHEVVYQTEENK